MGEPDPQSPYSVPWNAGDRGSELVGHRIGGFANDLEKPFRCPLEQHVRGESLFTERDELGEMCACLQHVLGDAAQRPGSRQ